MSEKFMNIRRLKGHKSASCCIREYPGEIVLQSYATDVAYIDRKTGILYVNGLYSTTTRRHLSWFIKEYFKFIRFEHVKKCALEQLGCYEGEDGKVYFK